MDIKFGIYTTPNPDKEGKKLSHARNITKGTKHMDDICDYISECASLTSADLKGALDALANYVADQLRYGYNVELEGLGTFSLSLKSRQTVNSKGKPTVTVGIDGVNFRTSLLLKERLKGVRPKKVKRVNKTTSTLEERKARMLNYLLRNNYINASDYAIHNSCTRYRATEDLKQFLAEGIILKMGHKTHRIYVLPQEEATDLL